MYQAQPSPSGGHGAVTLNCTDSTLECVPRCPGGNCADYAATPPLQLPRAPIAVDHRLPVRLLLTVSLLSAFLVLSLALATLLLYRHHRLLRRLQPSATAPLPHGDGFGFDDDGDEETGGGGGKGEMQHVWYIRIVGLDHGVPRCGVRRDLSGVPRRVQLWRACPPPPALLAPVPRALQQHLAPCRAHVNCPICRSPVVAPSNVLAASATNAETECGAMEEGQVFDEMSPSESLSEGSEDSDASSNTEREDREAAAEDNGRATPKPIRCSASMDSPLLFLKFRMVLCRLIGKFPSGREGLPE